MDETLDVMSFVFPHSRPPQAFPKVNVLFLRYRLSCTGCRFVYCGRFARRFRAGARPAARTPAGREAIFSAA